MAEIRNVPYVKKFDSNGVCVNPLDKHNRYQSRAIYHVGKLDPFGKPELKLWPNRSERRRRVKVRGLLPGQYYQHIYFVNKETGEIKYKRILHWPN